MVSIYHSFLLTIFGFLGKIGLYEHVMLFRKSSSVNILLLRTLELDECSGGNHASKVVCKTNGTAKCCVTMSCINLAELKVNS